MWLKFRGCFRVHNPNLCWTFSKDFIQSDTWRKQPFRKKEIDFNVRGENGNMKSNNQTCMNEDGEKIPFTSLEIYQDPDICHLLNRLSF